jgi:peptide/nickel transport system substrate-binding protein
MAKTILQRVIVLAMIVLLIFPPFTVSHEVSAQASTGTISCPYRGGTLIIIHMGDPKSFNPDAKADDPLYAIASNIFNKLVTLDVDYNVIPDLAESWETSPDAKVFTFHLRKNVKWHDGVPFTCKDVKYTFEAMKNYKGVAYSNLKLDMLEGITCRDDYTAEFRFSDSNAPFLGFLAWYGTFVLPEHLYNKTEYTDWMDPNIPALSKPVGTGPFKFVDYVKGSHVILEANKDYFAGAPCIDKLVFKIIPDAVAAMQSFLAGEGDVLGVTPPLSEIPRINSTAGVLVLSRPMPSRYFLAYNMAQEKGRITLNKDVRFAIAYAINRTEIVEKAFSGYGFVAKGMYVPAITWAYNPNAQPPSYNPAKAEEILDKLGYKKGTDGMRYLPNGTKLTLKLVIWQGAQTEAMAQIIKENLRKIGIEVSIEVLELGAFQEKAYKEKDFDMSITDGFWGPDPHNMHMRFSSKGSHNLPGYVNPVTDDLLERAAKEPDLEKRRQLYWQAQEEFAKELPYFPLVDVVGFYISRTDWKGFYWELAGKVGINVYAQVWWAKGVTTTSPQPTQTTQPTRPQTQTTTTAPQGGLEQWLLPVVAVVVVIIALALALTRRRGT